MTTGRTCSCVAFLCVVSVAVASDGADRRAFLRRFGLEEPLPASSSLAEPFELFLTNRFEVYRSTAATPAMRVHIERQLQRWSRLRPALAASGPVSPALPAEASRISNGENIYVYPNPARDQDPVFHVEAGAADRVEIRVSDLSGREVHRDVAETTGGAIERSWDVSGIGGGIYVYSVTVWKQGRTFERKGRCVVMK